MLANKNNNSKMTYIKEQPASTIFHATADDGTVTTIEVTSSGLVKYSTTNSSLVSTIQFPSVAAVKEAFAQVGNLL